MIFILKFGFKETFKLRYQLKKFLPNFYISLLELKETLVHAKGIWLRGFVAGRIGRPVGHKRKRAAERKRLASKVIKRVPTSHPIREKDSVRQVMMMWKIRVGGWCPYSNLSTLRGCDFKASSCISLGCEVTNFSGALVMAQGHPEV